MKCVYIIYVMYIILHNLTYCIENCLYTFLMCLYSTLLYCHCSLKVTSLPTPAALSLPLGRTTVMHMIVRERVPEEQSTGMLHTQVGVECHWWFNPSPLLDAEFEFACLSG